VRKGDPHSAYSPVSNRSIPTALVKVNWVVSWSSGELSVVDIVVFLIGVVMANSFLRGRLSIKDGFFW
jgi:hypothetical protein